MVETDVGFETIENILQESSEHCFEEPTLMAQGLSLLIVVQCLLSFLIHCIGATELVEIPPPSTTGLSRRDDYSSLNLKDEDIYLWGGKHCYLQIISKLT